MKKPLRAAMILTLAVLLALPTGAKIDVALQMQLGNPSKAAADAANHRNYLIQRPQYALDYNDSLGTPNWVSWDLTAGDVGSSGRTVTYSIDPALPATFYAVTDSDYSGVGNINFNRGHMCPSEDRTVTAADNQQVFFMSNIVPQAADNNQGPWEAFETYCRTLADAGSELLIIAGPGGFTPGNLLPSGKAAIPGFVWKIVVVVPAGNDSALNRITSSTRVIALKLPNLNGIRSTPWQNYVTTVNQLQVDTGLTFFTALPATIANALRTVTDATSTAGSPAITVQPAAQAAQIGGSATFSVTAVGNAPLSYQWSKDGTSIVGASQASLTLFDIKSADFGSYSVVVSNAVGSLVSAQATLTASSNPGALTPIVWDFGTATPTSALPTDLTVTALTQGNNNGTTAMLTSTSVSGNYAGASGGNNAGAAARPGALNPASGGSAFFEFTVTAAAGREPWVTALSFGARSTATGPQAFGVYTSADSFSVPVAVGPLANNSAWSMQAPAFYPTAGPRGGSVTIRIYGYNGTGNAAVSTANWRIDDLSVTAAAVDSVPVSNTRFANLAGRARIGAAEQAAITGFTITGSGAKTVLLRAAGPALAGFGVTAPLLQPKIELFQGSASRGFNTGWSGGGGSAAVAAATASSGAFPFPMGSADSAMLVTLAPGNYTAIASGADGRPGVGLVEVYDVPGGEAQAKLASVALRAMAGAGADSLIAGIVVSGDRPRRVLLRAAGPALAQFGVTGFLGAPQLILQSGNTILSQNAGWSTSAEAGAIARAAGQLGLFAFSAGSQDSALIATLAPGAYTVQVASADLAAGIVLIEVYTLP